LVIFNQQFCVYNPINRIRVTRFQQPGTRFLNRVISQLTSTSSCISDSPTISPITSSSFDSPLCSSITPSLFHSRLKTYLFHKSYSPCSCTSFYRTAFTDRFFWATRFLLLVFSYFSVFMSCAWLSWLSRQLLSARKYTVSYRIVRATCVAIGRISCTECVQCSLKVKYSLLIWCIIMSFWYPLLFFCRLNVLFLELFLVSRGLPMLFL